MENLVPTNEFPEAAAGMSLAFPSKIGLGTWQFSESIPGLPSSAEADAIFREAYARGIRHVDTAQSYGGGRSESVVGDILAGFDDVFLATKIHYRPTVEDTLAAVRDSLKRLRRDRIDLVYLHWPRRGLDVRPVMEGLEKARSLGMIRYVGASNFSVPELASAAEVSRVDVLQLGYSLLWRYPERDVLPYCAARGIAVVTYSALAQGLLAGRIQDRSGMHPEDPRLKTVFYDEEVFPLIHAGIQKMSAAIAAETANMPAQVTSDSSKSGGITLARMALAWVLDRPGVSASLLGAKSPGQIADIMAGDSASLSDLHRPLMDNLTRISDELIAAIPDVGNIFRSYP